MNATTLNLTLTGRHMVLTDGLKQFAAAKSDSLGKLFRYPVKVRMVLDTQKHTQRCTVSLTSLPNIHFRAHCESDNMYRSIEEGLEKLKMQIHKFHTRVRHFHEHTRERQKLFANQAFRPNSHSLKMSRF